MILLQGAKFEGTSLSQCRGWWRAQSFVNQELQRPPGVSPWTHW